MNPYLIAVQGIGGSPLEVAVQGFVTLVIIPPNPPSSGGGYGAIIQGNFKKDEFWVVAVKFLDKQGTEQLKITGEVITPTISKIRFHDAEIQVELTNMLESQPIVLNISGVKDAIDRI